MGKITDTNGSHIINFSKPFSSCYTRAKEYFQNDEYDDALQEANIALSLDYNADVLLLLADIYMEKECYDMVMSCACQVLALGNLDQKKRERLFLLIPKALSEMDEGFASFFYILRNSPDIAETLAKVLPDEESLESIIGREMSSILEEDKNREDDNFLVLADEKREKYNEETLGRAMDLVSKGELNGAKFLLKSLYDNGSSNYLEGVRLLSSLYANEGNTDKACKLLYDEFQKNKTNSDLLSAVYEMGEDYRLILSEMLNDYVPTDDIDSVLEAISIASACGEDYIALNIAEELNDMYFDDAKCNITRILAKWNCNNDPEVKKELMRFLYLMRAYYPAKYIEKITFPERFDLSFIEFPNELLPKLSRVVQKAINDYVEGDDYNELLTAVIFLIKNLKGKNIKYVDNMIYTIEVFGGQIMLDMYRRITSTAYIHPEIQKYVIEQLVDKYRRGTFFFNNEGFIMEITLRVPPSYDDFSPREKYEYCKTFSLMAEFDNTFEKQLSEIFEKIYLSNAIFKFPRNCEFSLIVGFLLVMNKSPESVHEFCKSMSINQATYKKYAEKLKSILEED